MAFLSRRTVVRYPASATLRLSANGRSSSSRRPFHDDLRRRGQAAVHRRGPARARSDRRAGAVPVHARRLRLDVPRPPLDDAPVRGLRHRRGDQRALPLPARSRPDRPLHGVRHAVAHGARLRSPAVARRGWPRGGGCRHAGRYGDALPWHTHGRCFDFYDHQRASGRNACVLRRSGRAPGRTCGAAGGDDSDRHPQGVHRSEGVVLPDRTGDAPRHRHDRVLLEADAEVAPGLDLRLSHPRGWIDRSAGAGVHAEGRLHVRRAGDRARARRRRLRATAVVLLQRAHRLLRGDREVPRGRRIWARELRDTYGAKNERSMLMRFHTQTAGVSLTAQQPLNNIVRTAIEALAGVLGGTQSLHTNSFDEALALPTEEAVRVALRTQQIIAHETGVVNTADPLGGAYFVEALTDRMEAAAYEYFAKIDELGGMVQAI